VVHVRLIAKTFRRAVPSRYGTVGLVVAAAGVCFSLTPSLLPRSPVFQGVVSGIVAAVGYAAGTFACWALTAAGRRLPDRYASRRPSTRTRVLTRRTVFAVAPAAILVMLVLGGRWQRQAGELVGQPRDRPLLLVVGPTLQILVVALLVFVILVGLARALRTASRRVADRLPARVPGVLAGVFAAAVVSFVVVLTVNEVVMHRVLGALDDSFAVTNQGTADGVQRPASGLRSGGPGSLMPWGELGYEGRTFVAGGPSVAELSAFAGRQAEPPIRVYGGLETDEDPGELAARVVLELGRTGAFERDVLCVAVPTGRGWVNEDAAEALEFMYGGDSAIAAMQYSYLPSPLAFLVDPLRAERAGQELFDRIHRHWSGLPAGRRPRLLVYGESLGSTGVQAAFRDITDVEDRTQGALFVGPPHSNALWSTAVRHRDPGSPMVLPVYDGGRNVRFASAATDLSHPNPSWQVPRIVFMQHPSDPIVWWSPDLLLRRPDWLEEPRGSDVNPAMRWYPIVTFWQVTADMAVSNSPPSGHGHRYDGFARTWSDIAAPPGWTSADTARLSARLA
jgi:uncharacterized membrane protein